MPKLKEKEKMEGREIEGKMERKRKQVGSQQPEKITLQKTKDKEQTKPGVVRTVK